MVSHTRIVVAVVVAASLSVLLLSALVLFYAAAPRRLLPISEVVLRPGMSVTADTPDGPVTIAAGDGARRTYSGAGWSAPCNMVVRSGRWYGSLGLYGPRDPFLPWPGGDLIVEEGQQHFASVQAAMGWMKGYCSWCQPVYSRSGLVVCYRAQPTSGNFGQPLHEVCLWQFYVAGRRPLDLPGGDDRSIRVAGGEIPDRPLNWAQLQRAYGLAR